MAAADFFGTFRPFWCLLGSKRLILRVREQTSTWVAQVGAADVGTQTKGLNVGPELSFSTGLSTQVTNGDPHHPPTPNPGLSQPPHASHHTPRLLLRPLGQPLKDLLPPRLTISLSKMRIGSFNPRSFAKIFNRFGIRNSKNIKLIRF